MGRPKEVTDEQIVAAARRCFLERGTSVSASDIARELGVSHTTIFNRFRSKKALIIAALAPPQRVPWVAALEAGPDGRPVREQLVEHAKVMSAYFDELQTGLGVLHAAGIGRGRSLRVRRKESPPEQAFRALTGWLRCAQSEGRLAKCDIEALASTILAALHGWAFTARVCGQSTRRAAGDRHVERFIDVLWNGIGVDPGRS